MINSVSIVCKLIYGGKSVLLCGDAVGRPRGGQEDALIAEEKYLVEKAPELLNSDILVAPHHGADNANSLAFIRKVSPDYVIFSAGHSVYDHPRKSTAMRYLNFVSTERILRTDRGDDDGPDEWDYLRIPGCVDIYGDDNIEIVISSDGNYSVKYLDPQEDIADTGD
jgi:hypothetical protein